LHQCQQLTLAGDVEEAGHPTYGAASSHTVETRTAACHERE
jgi:hypothetical protein